MHPGNDFTDLLFYDVVLLTRGNKMLTLRFLKIFYTPSELQKSMLLMLQYNVQYNVVYDLLNCIYRWKPSCLGPCGYL